MDTTLAPHAPASRASGALDRMSTMPAKSTLLIGVAAALLAATIAATALWSNQPEWRVLYTNLGDKDGGNVIAALAQMNVPHRFSEGGGAIMAPAAQVHDARLRLASQGLPRGGAVGFELMENQRFGATQFQERVNFQRGLEGELARSIMALAAVQSARVHLALPQQTAFLREQQKPSGSVLLTLYPGRALERGQIAGIVHLVASSVSELNPAAVSVVDQTGALLSQAPGDPAGALDAGQLQHVRELERSLAARVLAIVEPLVGPGNVKAQVTADVDFTRSESTSESYGPNQGQSPAAVRSQQLSEAPGGASAGAQGIPGALSNQPSAAASAPVNGPAQALSASGAPASSGNRREAVTNYEVDKTVKITRSAAGALRRLNAAVVVNHALGADGKAVALAPEQMDQIRALVRETIGFSQERGDSVNVVNAPFQVLKAPPPPPELPLWKQPEMHALARGLAPWIALPLVALVILLGLVRPALRQARARAAPARLLDTRIAEPLDLPSPGDADRAPAQPPAAALGGAPELPLLQTAQAAAQHARTRQLEGIRVLARQDPATVANVVRNWVSQPSS